MQSEILFLECRAELPRDRFRGFTGNHPQTSRKRVSSSDRPIEQIQSFREMLLKTAQSPAPLNSHIHQRNYTRRSCNKNRQWKSCMEESSQNESETGQDPTSHNDLAGPGFHSGLQHEVPKTRRPIPLHHHAVQNRHTANQLIANELHSEVNVAAPLGSLHRLHPFSNHLLAALRSNR